MATDPTALIMQLVNAGGNIGQQFVAGQQQGQQQALGAQQLQAGAMQLQQAQAQQAQAQQYQQDAAEWVKRGAPPRDLPALAAKYPQQAKALQDAWKMKNDDAKQADQSFFGQTHAALANGATDLAVKNLQARRDAESKAGGDTSELDYLIDQVKNGGDAGAKLAKGVMLGHIYASDPDKYADVFGLGKDQKDTTHVINPGGALVDSQGKELYRASEKVERPVEVPVYDDSGRRIGTRLIPIGSAPGGAPTAGRTVGGWTPRQSNGGDNSDAAVDSKIAGASKLLGVDPNADLSTVSPIQIAKAMAYGEGGSGSLADRNNNPANLRNTDGSYKKFPTPEAGINAAASLVASKLRKGQTTVKSLIEGLPVGGGSSDPNYIGPEGGAASAAAIKQGDLSTVPQSIRASVQAIADGRSAPPRPGSRNGEALLDAVTAYDPTFDAANATSRVKTRVDFTSGKSAQNITAMNTAMGHLIHLDDLAHDLGNFSTLPGLLNPIYNATRSAAGNTTLGQFEQTKQAASSELRKVFAGQSGGNLEELRQFEANLSSSKSPEQLHAVIQNAVELLGSRLNALQDQYTQGMGRSDQIPTFIKPSLARQAQQRFGIDLGSGQQASQPAAQTAAPVKVASRAQALALPSGTKFLDPNGVLRVRP